MRVSPLRAFSSRGGVPRFPPRPRLTDATSGAARAAIRAGPGRAPRPIGEKTFRRLDVRDSASSERTDEGEDESFDASELEESADEDDDTDLLGGR